MKTPLGNGGGQGERGRKQKTLSLAKNCTAVSETHTVAQGLLTCEGERSTGRGHGTDFWLHNKSNRMPPPRDSLNKTTWKSEKAKAYISH